MVISPKLLTAMGWAVIVQTIFLIFTLVRVFTAKHVIYDVGYLHGTTRVRPSPDC